jgi:hypothetical protein
MSYTRKTNINTGEDAQVQGLYSSDCCEWQESFCKGECFRRCPVCESLCEWELLKPPVGVVPPNETEDTQHKGL